VLAQLGLAARPTWAQPGSAEARQRELRAEIARIQRERDSLQAELRRLEGAARNAVAEARNLERQADATARAVNAYDRQLRSIESQLDSASGALVRAQDELVLKQATLQRRLVDIYKRGPLYTYEALLSAASFGDLIARYKYLHVIARNDRALVRRTEQLRSEMASRHDQLAVLQNDLAFAREAKADEVRRLRALETRWQQTEARTRRSAQQVETRLRQRAADMDRLSNAIAAIEAERRRAESARGNAAGASRAAAGSFNAADANRLDWPVDGDIIYSFGRLQNPNNTTVRWDGIGIAAPEGAPVRAIYDGEVILAEPYRSFGNTIVLRHGDDYTVYSSLGRIAVAKGDRVQLGQVIGSVGVTDPELGAHLHFEIRPNGGKAVDPLDWLRARQR
jgi:septal ring factor EnvC (AmiA/AmiB activator)